MATSPSLYFRFVVLGVCAIAIARMTPPTLAQAPAVPAQVFSPDSFWYKALPLEAPLHPNSGQFVREFLRQKRSYYGTVTINTVAWASPVYVADETTQAVVVRPWDCQNKGYIDRNLAWQWQSVPIPAYAQPAD